MTSDWNNSNRESNWFAWDPDRQAFDFAQTENHVFGAYAKDAKRIGDMTRDELIAVIAAGYHEREQLANACRAALGERHRLSAGVERLLSEAVHLVTPYAEPGQ